MDELPAPESVTRTKVPVAPTDEDDERAIRVYFSYDNDLPPMPSVSVVKDLRVDPEKADAIEGWENRYDGQSQWGRPWFEDQKAFKAFRGTLVHFAILDALGDASGDSYFHAVGDSDWGYEEYYAEYHLKKWSLKSPSANTEEVPYTPRNNEYDGEHAWDKAVRGMSWATRAFKEHVIDEGRLDPSDVIAVEEYVYDQEYGYGGQFDLLYEDDVGNVVCADLKTSSAIRFDHKLQAAAYKRAIETNANVDIDCCEIIRLHPDSETVEVSRSEEWDRSLAGLAHEFLGLCDEAHNCQYAEALEHARIELLEDRDRTEQSELDETNQREADVTAD